MNRAFALLLGLLFLVVACEEEPSDAAPAAPSTATATATAASKLPLAVVTAAAPPSPTIATNPVFYANCDAVKAARKAPIRRGDPGYGSHLDRDGDGIACET